KITFVVTNRGQFAHNFTVTGDSGTVAKTPNFSAADGEQTLEVELQPGTYTIICDLPGHAARGQQTELVVIPAQ
ncbi:MAG TPA: sulfocyanin-like copper-binding protein, partial [Chloroflexia bacterium]|nr:sulfocyanin-like copper-binding protein [Chloroflexia bacterium]